MTDTESRLLLATQYNEGYALMDAAKEIDALTARVVQLRNAIDEALAIIAGGNPELPAEVLAEVELHLQEAYVINNRDVSTTK